MNEFRNRTTRNSKPTNYLFCKIILLRTRKTEQSHKEKRGGGEGEGTHSPYPRVWLHPFLNVLHPENRRPARSSETHSLPLLAAFLTHTQTASNNSLLFPLPSLSSLFCVHAGDGDGDGDTLTQRENAHRENKKMSSPFLL